MSDVLRLGTRASLLARTQSALVADLIRARTGREVELVDVTTEGDANRASLVSLGGTGVFVGALRDALLRGDVDLAVHSLKDLPTAPHPGITLAAVPTREDPRDVVVARDGLTLGELPVGSVVGTGSPRRAAQLHALGLGLEIVDIRGNVDTRLGKVGAGEVDAVLLARAGLARLGRLDDVTEVIDPIQMLPAPGQGALAVECRSDDLDLVAEPPRARRPAHPGHRRGRASRARRARGRVQRAGRRARRDRRGRGRPTAPRSGSAPSPSPRTVPSPSAPPPLVPPATPMASEPASPSRCSTTAPPT